MDSNQLDKYNMLLKVDDFFDDHTADTGTHTLIDPKHQELEDLIAEIQPHAEEAMADHTGVTEDKGAMRKDMEQQVFTALTALSSFARDSNNRTLLKRVRRTLNGLEKMRNLTLYLHASVVIKMLNTHIGSLGAYAYTPAQQAALVALLPQFLDIIPEPKDAIEDRAVANEQVAELLTEADGILEDLDGYMDTFRFSNAALYSEYQMARAIDNSGGGTGGGEEGDYSASGMLTPMQSHTALEFAYDANLTYSFANAGPAPQLEVTLYQDGVLVATAPPLIVNMGTPVTGKLANWAPMQGNQLRLRNLAAAMSLNYTVSLSPE
jgi:hypothetical protein